MNYMNITTLIVFVAMLTIPISKVSAQGGTVRIAVVDLDRIIAISSEGRALANKLKKLQEQAQSEMTTMQSENDQIRRKLAREINVLSEVQINELQKQFEDTTVKIRRFTDDKQREGQKIKGQGLQEIEKKLEPLFKKIQDERDYDIILNLVPGVVVTAQQRINITNDIIDLLNSNP